MIAGVGEDVRQAAQHVVGLIRGAAPGEGLAVVEDVAVRRLCYRG